jgi:hypothetical protein
MFGRTIRLYLLEGHTNSLITAELSNWTGKALKIPRIKVKEYSSREEFRGPGIYILFGKNELGHEAAYIGEGEPVISRILDHLARKDFWNEVVIFVSKDKYLNKASIKHLENRLYKLGINAGRYDLDNDKTPTLSGVSEAEEAELEEFLSNVKLLTSTLGHKIFEEIEETFEKNKDQQLLFTCRNSAGAEGKGSPSTEGFTVFKGAKIMEQHQPSLTESIRLEKQAMIADGTLLLDSGFLVLTRHYTFNSSSRAAAMIVGRSARGPVEWKTESGRELREFE